MLYTVAKRILQVFEEEKREMGFKQIYGQLEFRNYLWYDQRAIATGLKQLIAAGYLEKFRGTTAGTMRPRYRLIKKVDS
jgi:hypothetical protein